jgi:hypothetical protein
MAFRLSFFKTPKHRVFNYQPLFYDAQKEDLNMRVSQAMAEREAELRAKKIAAGEDPRTREERLYYPGRSIRGSYQKALVGNRRRAGDNRWMRLVILGSIIALLVAAVYFADGIGLLLRAVE